MLDGGQLDECVTSDYTDYKSELEKIHILGY